MSDEKVLLEQNLGDGCTLSVVEAFCNSLADVVPTIRFVFPGKDGMQTLEAFLVNASTKELCHLDIADALLRYGESPLDTFKIPEDPKNKTQSKE